MTVILEKEGSKLLPCGIDHNVCPVCKKLDQKLLLTHTKMMLAKKDKNDELESELEMELDQIVLAQSRHIADDIDMRNEVCVPGARVVCIHASLLYSHRTHLDWISQCRASPMSFIPIDLASHYVSNDTRLLPAAYVTQIHRWVNLARELKAKARSNGVDLNGKHKFKSLDTVKVYHIDDMTTANIPSTPLQVGGRLEAYPVKLNGQHDMVEDTANIYLGGYGAASKDSNNVIDEIFLNLVHSLVSTIARASQKVCVFR